MSSSAGNSLRKEGVCVEDALAKVLVVGAAGFRSTNHILPPSANTHSVRE